MRGRLISAAFAESQLSAPAGYGTTPADVVQHLDRWSERVEANLGPASSARAIADAAVIPLLRILGYDVRGRTDRGLAVVLEADAAEISIPLVVTAWSDSLDAVWRDVVLDGVRADGRWGLACNGVSLRVIVTWNAATVAVPTAKWKLVYYKN